MSLAAVLFSLFVIGFEKLNLRFSSKLDPNLKKKLLHLFAQIKV